MPTTPRGANVYRASQGSQLVPEIDLESQEPEIATQDLERPLSNWVSDELF